MNYAAGFGIEVLLAFVLLGFALVVAVVFAVLSWRHFRRSESFEALAFPVSLPLLGIVCAALVDVPSWMHYPPVKEVWVGICTLAAVVIMARALWLRPGGDLNSADVRRSRQWEIFVTAVGAGLLYFVWMAIGLSIKHQFAQKEALEAQQQAAARAEADARTKE
jgi:hypothetical protein